MKAKKKTRKTRKTSYKVTDLPRDRWFITINEAANLIGVCKATFNRYRKLGFIPEPDLVFSARRKGYSLDLLQRIMKVRKPEPVQEEMNL